MARIFEKKMWWYIVKKVYHENLTDNKVGSVFGRETKKNTKKYKK